VDLVLAAAEAASEVYTSQDGLNERLDSWTR